MAVGSSRVGSCRHVSTIVKHTNHYTSSVVISRRHIVLDKMGEAYANIFVVFALFIPPMAVAKISTLSNENQYLSQLRNRP